jgi:archaeal flagellin FlaB
MNRRGLTGLETAIILVAFVITASAFSFVVLNMGMMSAEQAQSVISSSVEESSAALMMETQIIGTFDNTTGVQSAICLTKATFYLRLSQGDTPIDMDDGNVVITYTNPRCHKSVYDTNGTITTITAVAGDSDSILEVGEKFKVVIDFTEIDKATVSPAQADMNNVYTHPYEELRIEIQPSGGARLTAERVIPQVSNIVMGF